MSIKITEGSLTRIFKACQKYLNTKRESDDKQWPITSFQVLSGCSSNENFLSAVHNVKFTTEGHGELGKKQLNSFDLIIKARITSDGSDCDSGIDTEKSFWDLLFAKEASVYENFFNKLNSSLEQIGIHPVAPNLHVFYTEDDAFSCLVLDNLKSMGYSSPGADNQVLSFSDCSAVMKSLARLHAGSLLEETENQPLALKNELCTVEMMLSSNLDVVFRAMIQNTFNGVVNLSEKFRPDLTPKLIKLNREKSIWDRLCDLVKFPDSSFFCFCHGDPRLSNIFIKRNCKSDVQMKSVDWDLKFIDFQLTRYTSPMSDVLYAIFLNTDKAFRDQHLESILATYHSEFCAIVKQLSSCGAKLSPKVHSWKLDEMKREYFSSIEYGLLIALILLPLALMRPCDIDKSMSQSTQSERDYFYNTGRQQLIFSLGENNQLMRNRVFEICDQLVSNYRSSHT